MSEWMKNYVLNKSSYFIDYEDVREKIEIKCKEIEGICEKYRIQSKIKILNDEIQIMINNKEFDIISWRIFDENVIFKLKNKEINIFLNGINTYTVMHKRSLERKDTLDKAIDYAFEKLLVIG